MKKKKFHIMFIPLGKRQLFALFFQKYQQAGIKYRRIYKIALDLPIKFL